MKHLWPDTADTALYWRGLYLGIIRRISPHLTPLLSLLGLSSSDLDILNTRTEVNTKYPDTEILIILRQQVSMLTTKQKRRLNQDTGSLCLPFLILTKRLVLWDRVWLYKGWASVGCEVCHVYGGVSLSREFIQFLTSGFVVTTLHFILMSHNFLLCLFLSRQSKSQKVHIFSVSGSCHRSRGPGDFSSQKSGGSKPGAEFLSQLSLNCNS